LRKAIIFICLFCFLLTQQAFAEKRDREWEVIKRFSHKQKVYSLEKFEETGEYFLVKQEREKGKTEEVYRTSLGTLEDDINPIMWVKGKEIRMVYSDQDDISLISMEESTGKTNKKAKISTPKPAKKKSKKELQSKSSKKKASVSSKTLRASNETTTEIVAPEFFTVKTLSPSSATLEWTEVEGAESYRIYERLPFVDEEVTERRLVGETDSTSIEIKDLEGGELYLHYLRAVYSNGESDEMYVAIIPPTGTTFNVESGTDMLTFSWDPIPEVEEYPISIHGENGDKEEVTIEETEYTFEDLESRTPYLFVFDVEVDRSGFDTSFLMAMTYPSDADSEDKVPDFPDPPAPTGDLPAPENFKAVPDVTYADLTWDRVEDAEGYVIYVNGNEETRIDSGRTTSFRLKNLSPYHPYEVHLRALDADGKDGESSIQSFFTLPDHLDPPKVKIDKVTSVSAYLSWTRIKEARQYIISYNGQSKELKDPKVKVKGLQERNRYVFSVIAKHGRIESDPVQIEVETIPFTYTYTYDGTLLSKTEDSYEKAWDYSYDRNGNVTGITYKPKPKTEKQEFDISGTTSYGEVSDEGEIIENP